MDVKAYCNKRKLEMVDEVKKLEEKRKLLTSQGQQVQYQLNQVNAELQKKDIELEVLTKLEAEVTKEEEDAGSNSDKPGSDP